VPILGGEFYRRAADIPDSSELFGPLLGSWIFWGCYFLLLTSGSTLMILWRAHKTVIYNVDASQFSHALQETLEEIHISATKNSQRFVLTPTAPDSNAGSTAIAEAKPKPAMDERCAEVSVDMFPALANVTLHWDNYAPDVRADVERDLERTLQLAAPAENPAAGWFLSISGLIFGALFMVILTIAFMLVFSTRR
jgi:hypothetical protein